MERKSPFLDLKAGEGPAASARAAVLEPGGEGSHR